MKKARVPMRKLIIYGIPVVGVLAAFTVFHVFVRPITLDFLGYVAILTIMACVFAYIQDRWQRKD